jgi:3-methyladenine DNA glycosylase AlkD
MLSVVEPDRPDLDAAGPEATDPAPGGLHGPAAAEVRRLLGPVAQPDRAPAMAAYMKGIAPYLGITTPDRRTATAHWIRSFDPGPQARTLLSAADALVREPEREFAYVANDLVRRHHLSLPQTSLGPLRALAMHRPWWDTVDAWATLIGRVGLRHRAWDPIVAGWATDPQLWARRIALVFQVGRRDAVDLSLLFAACRANLADADFFMRKGIGWGLRDAARTHPDEIRAFVEDNRQQMSGLSIREATKHL